MIPYLLILFLVIGWIAFIKVFIKRKSVWIPTFMLSLFAGVRSYDVGTDTINYTYQYNENVGFAPYVFDDNVEKGYQIFDATILSFTHNYFWLLFLSAFFIVYSYLRLIKTYSIDYLSSVIIFITLGLYTFIFNGLRQAFALAIMTYSIKYLLEKRLLPYLIICLLASTFHISALIMIPFYFLINLKLKTLYKVLSIFIGSLILSSQAISYMAQNNERYESYTEGGKFGGLYTLGFYLILAVFIFFTNRASKIDNETFQKLSELYYMGVALLIPVALLGTNPSGPQRIISYFSWSLIIILPFVIKKFHSMFISFLFILLCMIYYYLTVSAFGDLTPYKFNPNLRLI